MPLYFVKHYLDLAIAYLTRPPLDTSHGPAPPIAPPPPAPPNQAALALERVYAFAEVDPEAFLGIFFSCGRAPEYIRYDADLVRITRHFFAAGKPSAAAKLAGQARTRIAEQLGLIEQNAFKLCWIVDFPMFEADEETGKIDFSHNPFSMPQGELEALETRDPLDILAFQYDVVCNGVELSSGAIRNHKPEIMYKAFEIAGYTRAQVDEDFSGMINAFKFGAPPHGGSAPGIDRIVMLIADEPNIREVVVFPMNQRAEDLMMNAPGPVTARQLRELHIRTVE